MYCFLRCCCWCCWAKLNDSVVLSVWVCLIELVKDFLVNLRKDRPAESDVGEWADSLLFDSMFASSLVRLACCFWYSYSWPKKLKLGDIVCLLSLTNL